MNDTTQSPYQPPESDISSSFDDDQVQAVKLFSAQGRVGRVRYIAYGMAYTLVYYLIIGAAFGLSMIGLPPAVTMIITAIVVVAMLVLMILLTIQRCHDMDKSGWWTFFILVPLLGILFFLCWPGTKGTNRFGPRTPKNGTGVILLACLYPVLMIAGILAAIAIPAYGSYVQKAQFTEVIQASAPVKLAMETCYQDTKDLSACNTWEKLNLGDQAGSDFVDSVQVDPSSASIVVTGSEEVGGADFVLTPSVAENGLTWTRGGSCKDAMLC